MVLKILNWQPLGFFDLKDAVLKLEFNKYKNQLMDNCKDF